MNKQIHTWLTGYYTVLYRSYVFQRELFMPRELSLGVC